jgi:hypothetical protein
MSETPHGLPIEKLLGAADDPASHAEIEALHEELAKARPSADAIAAHVEGFRDRPKLFAIVANWFEDTRTQTFLADLAGTGL